MIELDDTNFKFCQVKNVSDNKKKVEIESSVTQFQNFQEWGFMSHRKVEAAAPFPTTSEAVRTTDIISLVENFLPPFFVDYVNTFTLLRIS